MTLDDTQSELPTSRERPKSPLGFEGAGYDLHRLHFPLAEDINIDFLCGLCSSKQHENLSIIELVREPVECTNTDCRGLFCKICSNHTPKGDLMIGPKHLTLCPKCHECGNKQSIYNGLAESLA